ncbi:hypothetical protein BKA70DRAFT_115368 [Coprinopsis sp. MPI-PUGE-AT-0042]|nr:hypothetical protein BKA70DRAFT_115368 [Coprinopsis sp. MPI-PUGE-AT-0042]
MPTLRRKRDSQRISLVKLDGNPTANWFIGRIRESILSELRKRFQHNETMCKAGESNLQATFSDQENRLEALSSRRPQSRRWRRRRIGRPGGRAGVGREERQLVDAVHCRARGCSDVDQARLGDREGGFAAGEGGRDSLIVLNGLALAMEDIYSMYREEEVKKEETLGLRERNGGSSTQEGRGYRWRDRPLRHHGKGTLWSTRRALQVRWHNMWRKEQAPDNLKDRISGYHQCVDETIRNNCISCYQLKCQPIELSFNILNEARNPFRSPSTTIKSAVHLLDGFNSEAVSFTDNVEAGTFFWMA